MRPALAPVLVALALVMVPHATGQAAVPSIIEGGASASTFQVRALGHALEGGAAEWTLVCALCTIRITITEPGIHVVGDGAARALTPGLYEIREFRGFFSHTQQDEGFFVVFAGAGHVARL